ncbi:MAG: GxxExxY protein [Elusimicrobia bacterium]|nr:GxxExxY protein [Elusimicrobiota bacterium]
MRAHAPPRQAERAQSARLARDLVERRDREQDRQDEAGDQQEHPAAADRQQDQREGPREGRRAAPGRGQARARRLVPARGDDQRGLPPGRQPERGQDRDRPGRAPDLPGRSGAAQGEDGRDEERRGRREHRRRSRRARGPEESRQAPPVVLPRSPQPVRERRHLGQNSISRRVHGLLRNFAGRSLVGNGKADHEDTKTRRTGRRVNDEQREPIPADVEKVSGVVVDAAFKIHKTLGPGLLESVYEHCLCHELRRRGVFFQSQQSLPIRYDGLLLDAGLRIDLVVARSVIVELKAAEGLRPVFTAQLLTYLKLTGLRLGLLINFNVPVLREGIRRVVL